MEQEKLVSIVIPVYNAEKYIERCLDSVINQTYKNLEIIIVNDGSTDNTKYVLDKYSKEDIRIKIINKENEGVSVARNRGIEESKGKYICFVDSDDFIDINMIENLYYAIKKEDISLGVCGYKNVFFEETTPGLHLYNEVSCLKIEDYIFDMSKYLYSVYFGALWNKIFEAKIIKNYRIKFQEKVSYAEDFLFVMEYLTYVKKVSIIPNEFYFYYQENLESLTKNRNVWELWEYAFFRMKKCVNFYKSKNMYELCKKYICTTLASELIGPTYQIVNDSTINRKEAIEKIKSLYSDELIREAVKYTTKPNMVHKIAKCAIRIRSYKAFYFLMKIWIKMQNYKKG